MVKYMRGNEHDFGGYLPPHLVDGGIKQYVIRHAKRELAGCEFWNRHAAIKRCKELAQVITDNTGALVSVYDRVAKTTIFVPTQNSGCVRAA